MAESMRKIGFVTPWYGEEIGGGAEAELRGIVHHLQEAGVKLEVLTTCVRSFSGDWGRNELPEGASREAGIPVRRFPVRERDRLAFDRVNGKIMRGERVTPEEEQIFCREMVNSPALVDYLRTHGEEYALFVLIPYMFGPVYYASRVYPEKTVLIPCLHEESYAHMRVFERCFRHLAGSLERGRREKVQKYTVLNMLTLGKVPSINKRFKYLNED